MMAKSIGTDCSIMWSADVLGLELCRGWGWYFASIKCCAVFYIGNYAVSLFSCLHRCIFVIWFLATLVYIKCCHDLRVHRAHIGFVHCSIWFMFLYNQLTQVYAAVCVAFVGLRANVWGNAVFVNAPTFFSCPCNSSDMAMWCVVYMMAFFRYGDMFSLKSDVFCYDVDCSWNVRFCSALKFSLIVWFLFFFFFWLFSSSFVLQLCTYC